MANAYVRYVTWVSRGKRHHGSTSVDITPPPPPSHLSNGDVFQPPWAPSPLSYTDSHGTHNLNFAFWSVTGGTDGAYFSTQNTPPPANVGGSDIHATAWYFETGGGGDGGPGVIIDAFDVDLGNFVDDDFVSISPDAALTAGANNDGFVPTKSLEHVNAFSAIHGVPFYNWTVIAGSEVVSNTDLTAAAKSSAIAFAFYQSSHGHIFRPRDERLGTWVSWGVMVDGGGPTGNGPVPPWSPFIRQLAAGFALAEAAGVVSPQLRSAVLELAAQQVSIASKAIEKEMHQAGK